MLLVSSPLFASNDTTLERLMHQVAQEEGVDPALLRAVVAAESGFDPYAVSPAGAVGLMQLMKPTAIDMGVRNRYDPQQNLRGGARYLRLMMDQFSSLPLALAAYNAGPGAVSQYNGIPPYDETRDYVKKVLGLYKGKGATAYKALQRTGAIRLPQSNKKIYSYRDANGTLVLTDVNPKKSPSPTTTVKVAPNKSTNTATSVSAIRGQYLGKVYVRKYGKELPVIRVVRAGE